MQKNDYKHAHRFSSYHRQELENDDTCGCFYCIKIFSPPDIEQWIDNAQTALCPYCGIDSIIGESSGYPITETFLKGMHMQWF
ncbi:cytoplasmic protein [Lottiidibacillus patelloidae]|uniref:Cytoplasmic protein n=1 Tax=Lottiidibacillus patelloidae TaxID=2670334 RepID=A0A263BSQ2_9BACI|nr:cytoplasmic protein [Lottiidibacillus patelloidae]OZM56725.1 cytoplasmic protein [Lottiidibacillus patelloidae]